MKWDTAPLGFCFNIVLILVKLSCTEEDEVVHHGIVAINLHKGEKKESTTQQCNSSAMLTCDSRGEAKSWLKEALSSIQQALWANHKWFILWL